MLDWVWPGSVLALRWATLSQHTLLATSLAGTSEKDLSGSLHSFRQGEVQRQDADGKYRLIDNERSLKERTTASL